MGFTLLQASGKAILLDLSNTYKQNRKKYKRNLLAMKGERARKR